MIDGDCSSNSRSRSICVLRPSGTSGSSFRNARSLSPISLTIAQLCVWFMSMRLGITKPRSGKKAPASETQHLRLPTPPAAFSLASTAGDSEWNRRPPLLALRDMRRVVTAGDGLTLPSRGGHFRSRSLVITAEIILIAAEIIPRSLAALAWFRVAACDLRLGERPGGLLPPLGPLRSTWPNHIAHQLPLIGRRELIQWILLASSRLLRTRSMCRGLGSGIGKLGQL
jgi:hypothetical protein